MLLRLQRHPPAEPVAHRWHRYFVRVWVLGVRVHHGALGVGIAPVGVAVVRRNPRTGAGILTVAVLSAWDDRSDWREWFVVK